MPTIVPYEAVLRTAQRMGLRCVYANSGAFAFAESQPTYSVGWTGPEDPTIRAEAQPLVRRVPAPYGANLARLLGRAWRDAVHAPTAWVMPTSHWAYELQFGSRDWMPPLLEQTGVDARVLAARNQADAIEFAREEAEQFQHLALRLLEMMRGSDFSVLFPDQPVLARLHHHKQIWWTSPSAELIAAIEAVRMTSA